MRIESSDRGDSRNLLLAITALNNQAGRGLGRLGERNKATTGGRIRFSWSHPAPCLSCSVFQNRGFAGAHIIYRAIDEINEAEASGQVRRLQFIAGQGGVVQAAPDRSVFATQDSQDMQQAGEQIVDRDEQGNGSHDVVALATADDFLRLVKD